MFDIVDRRTVGLRLGHRSCAQNGIGRDRSVSFIASGDQLVNCIGELNAKLVSHGATSRANST